MSCTITSVPTYTENSNPKHRKIWNQTKCANENCENIKELQNKKQDVLKSQIIKSDLKSNKKETQHVHNWIAKLD